MSQSVYTVGPVELDTDKRTLSSTRGHLILQPQVFAVAERLMRRPGIIVERSDLIAAMYAKNPDCEPDDAEDVLRHRIRGLRGMLLALASEQVVLSTAYGVGHSIQERRR